MITALLLRLARAASPMHRRLFILTDNLAALRIGADARARFGALDARSGSEGCSCLSEQRPEVRPALSALRCNWAAGPSRQRDIQEELYVKPIAEETSTSSAPGALSNAQMRNRRRRARSYHG